MLDDQALITPDLLKLTRWLADYYLCGWGQVLNAVVPAEVRERAGTHNVILIELVSETLWPKPLPPLTPKQKSVLELLQVAWQADRAEDAGPIGEVRQRADSRPSRQEPGPAPDRKG